MRESAEQNREQNAAVLLHCAEAYLMAGGCRAAERRHCVMLLVRMWGCGKEIFCLSASSIHLTCAKSYIFKVKSVQITTLSRLPWVGTTHELLINNVIFLSCFQHQKCKTINKDDKKFHQVKQQNIYNILKYNWIFFHWNQKKLLPTAALIPVKTHTNTDTSPVL